MLRVQVVPSAQVHSILSSALCNSTAALFDDPVSSDVVVKAGDATVHAHKVVLAAQSLPFNAMLQVSPMHAHHACTVTQTYFCCLGISNSACLRISRTYFSLLEKPP